MPEPKLTGTLWRSRWSAPLPASPGYATISRHWEKSTYREQRFDETAGATHGSTAPCVSLGLFRRHRATQKLTHGAISLPSRQPQAHAWGYGFMISVFQTVRDDQMPAARSTRNT